MKTTKTLKALFSFPGFEAQRNLEGIFGEPQARVIRLKRQKKQLSAQDAAKDIAAIMTAKKNRCETLTQEAIEYTYDTNNGEWTAPSVWVSE